MFGIRRLLIPAATLLALPFARSRGEEKNVRAVYLFHHSGDPLVTVASDDVLPFESKHLEPLLDAVRDFVDSPEPAGHGIQQTTRRFGEEGVVGGRGQFVRARIVVDAWRLRRSSEPVQFRLYVDTARRNIVVVAESVTNPTAPMIRNANPTTGQSKPGVMIRPWRPSAMYVIGL